MKHVIKEASRVMFRQHFVFLSLVFMAFVGITRSTGLDLNSWAGTCLILICAVAAIAAQLFFGIAMIRIPDFVAPDPMHVDSEYSSDEYAAPDPWEMQRRLMAASDQPLPAVPTMSNNAVLYGALIMEEGGETFCALAAALDAQLESVALPSGEVAQQYEGLRYLANRFAAIGELNQESSRMLRASLARCEPLNWEIPEEYAIDIFDGSTDLAVVNAGLALACGFPGQRGYNEVARSNLSKRDPETGKIDKTADGKWIKGANFFKPNLAAVLQAAREEAWIERPDDHQWGTAPPTALAHAHAWRDAEPSVTNEEESAWRDLEERTGAAATIPAPTRGI
jgi:hypothetical protein